MNDIAIKVENLAKVYKLYDKPVDRLKEAVLPFGRQYHKDFYALRDVSLEVKKGESIGIIGKNGSGKSTLLKILSSVITPTSGNVSVLGNVSALLELGAGFNRQLTGMENIYFNGTLLGFTREQMDEKLDDILSFADIGDYVHQPMKSYSSGMFVRLAFAVKTSLEPDILIVDEALAVGDINFRQKCYDRMEDMRSRGLTWVLVAHDIQAIKSNCDRCFYLKGGKIEMEGDPEIVTERYLKDSFEERQKAIGAAGQLEWKDDAEKAGFGTGKAKILNTSIGKNGEGKDVFNYGDMIDIEVSAFADRSVVNPDVVIQLRDNRGYAIYGVRSSDLTRIEDMQVNGDRNLRAGFSFQAVLAPGQYSIVVGLNDNRGENDIILHDKIVGALNFTMLRGDSNFNGVVDLKAACLLKSESKLNTVQSVQIDKSILESLQKTSRHFFSGVVPNVMRTFEYPWIVEKSHPHRGKVFLDIGAGVSPLPLYLAEHGGQVVTVDHHPKVRTAEKALEKGNAWGFLDYSDLNENIRSYNEDIFKREFDEDSFDCIYSVSVIEHMPAHVRRELCRKIGAWLRPGGIVLLTVDLVPGTEELWNLAEGVQVDPEGEHGDVQALTAELRTNNLDLVSCDYIRDIQDSRVDCALLVARKKE